MEDQEKPPKKKPERWKKHAGGYNNRRDETLNNAHKEMSAAQGALMLVHKLFGKSLEEIAEIFNCTESSVKYRMNVAQRAGLLDLAQDLVKKRLAPQAIAVYESKLQQGDLDAARDVLFGTGILQKTNKVTVAPEAESLAQWKEQYYRAALPGEVTEVKDETVE